MRMYCEVARALDCLRRPKGVTPFGNPIWGAQALRRGHRPGADPLWKPHLFGGCGFCRTPPLFYGPCTAGVSLNRLINSKLTEHHAWGQLTNETSGLL